MLPFSTSLIAHAGGERLAFELYFANQLAIALCMSAQLELARYQQSLLPDLRVETTRAYVWWITLLMFSTVLSAAWLPAKSIWIPPMALGLSRRVWRRWTARRTHSRA